MKNLQSLVFGRYALKTYRLALVRGERVRIHCDVVLRSSGKILAEYESATSRIGLIQDIVKKMGLL